MLNQVTATFQANEQNLVGRGGAKVWRGGAKVCILHMLQADDN